MSLNEVFESSTQNGVPLSGEDGDEHAQSSQHNKCSRRWLSNLVKVLDVCYKNKRASERYGAACISNARDRYDFHIEDYRRKTLKYALTSSCQRWFASARPYLR